MERSWEHCATGAEAAAPESVRNEQCPFRNRHCHGRILCRCAEFAHLVLRLGPNLPVFGKNWRDIGVVVFNRSTFSCGGVPHVQARKETMSRRARELTVDQTALVAAVRRISRQRTKINTNYVMSILRAREEGSHLRCHRRGRRHLLPGSAGDRAQARACAALRGIGRRCSEAARIGRRRSAAQPPSDAVGQGDGGTTRRRPPRVR